MRTTAALSLTICLAVAPWLSTRSALAGVPVVDSFVGEVTRVADLDVGWQTRTEDHIAGLSDAKNLSNPARVDYDDLMSATPEMKQMRKDRIDPNSAEGVQLTTAAQSRVQRACQALMAQDGHCSIWKTITHSDGRSVTDATAAAKRLL